MPKKPAASGTANDPKASPDYKSAAYQKLAPSWKMTCDLWGSSLDIRNLNEEYLPRFKKEPAEKYAERKANSVFENDFRLTIETMAGMVFRKDPKPEGVAPQIDDLFADIDQCGNSFWSWALDAFEMYLRDGNGYIYIDAPQLKEEIAEKMAEGVQPTLADRQGDKPFWVFYKASQVANARYEKRGSREVLAQISLEETTREPDGDFGEKQVTRYRVLRPGSWQLFAQNEKTKAYDVLVDEGVTGLDYIPLIPIDEMDSIPPLLTLALLNVLNYNQTSDYDNICHLVCTPRFVQKYDKKEDAEAAGAMQTASPSVGLRIWGEHASASYVEVEGKGMELARERYQDVKSQMGRIGVGMLAPTDLTAIRTATEIVDTASQRQSKLARFARNFENAVEKALYTTAEIINGILGSSTINLDDAEQTAKMKLQIDYDRLTFTMDQIQFFSDLVDGGKLSLETFLKWLRQVMDMPADFDPEQELKKIAAVNTIVTEKMPPKPEPRPNEPAPEPPAK